MVSRRARGTAFASLLKKHPGRDPRYEKFLKQRIGSRQRGIPWRLEFWEWLQIWEDSGHFEDRGTKKGQWVMSRPGDVGAYEAGNVKIVLASSNVSEAALIRVRKRRAKKSSKSLD